MPNINVPPPPLDTQDTTVWGAWYIRIKDAINQLRNNLAWTSLSFTGSNITDIVTRNHNSLNNFQGGTTSQFYHLTSAQHSGLTGGTDSTNHYHASDRTRANHTGTQTLSTISDAGTAASQSGLSVTITTAKITSVTGVDGSMTFTNGVLTAQTQAT
jgi:uncharacterized protein YpuA (DUF1002 family)